MLQVSDENLTQKMITVLSCPYVWNQKPQLFPCFLHENLVKLDSNWQFWILLIKGILISDSNFGKLPDQLHYQFTRIWLCGGQWALWPVVMTQKRMRSLMTKWLIGQTYIWYCRVPFATENSAPFNMLLDRPKTTECDIIGHTKWITICMH